MNNYINEFIKKNENYIKNVKERNLNKSFNITPEEYSAIYRYTQGDSVVNKLLLQGIEPNNYFKGLIELMDSALKKLPSYSGLCYRVFSTSSNEILNYKTGEIYKYPGYLSTSRGGYITGLLNDNELYNCYFKINVKNGKDISQMSVLPDEEETLLLRNISLKINLIEKKGKNIYFNLLQI